MKKRLKLNGLIMFIATLVVAFFPSVFFRGTMAGPIEEITEGFGITFILLGQLLRASSRGHKSEHSREGGALIQTGPYSLVRNPMYLGILLIGLGIVLILFRWWVAGVFLFFFIIRYTLLIFTEEKKLKTLFSEEYAGYQKRVPRLLPKLNMLIQQDPAAYLPLKWLWIKKELGSILGVLLGTLLIESWEDIKTAGMAKYFRESVVFLFLIGLFICLAVYLSKSTANLEDDASDESKNITK